MTSLILIGMPASGKSSVGHALANACGLPYRDTDRLLEETHGPIADVLATRGEPAFRLLERQVLEEALAGPPAVVSTGGGVVTDGGSRELLACGGVVVYLDAPLPLLWGRLERDGSKRPLVQGSREQLERLFVERRPLYRQMADLTLAVEGTESPAELARRLEGLQSVRKLAPRVFLGRGLHAKVGLVLGPGKGPLLLVSDPGILDLHGQPVVDSLTAAGWQVRVVEVPPGEAAKNLREADRLYHEALMAGLERSSPMVALGGGTVGDLTGFVAATYLRGVPFYQIPTTLLAQVDASIGGKTGVDLPEGKNLVGAFHPPQAILIDPDLLDTLPEAEWETGMAEVVKYGLIGDPELYDLLRAGAVRGPLLEPLRSTVIERSAFQKLQVVGMDPKEAGRRAILNFGHTMGHAIEQVAGYRLSHGRAVAIGMVGAIELGRRLGGFFAHREEVERLLERLGLPTRMPPFPVEDCLTILLRDKKKSGGEVPFVLLPGLGEAEVVRGIPLERVREVLLWLGAGAP